MSSPVWHPDGALARLATPRLTAEVDRSRPELGIHQPVVDGVALPGQQWLGVELPAAEHTVSAGESFLRGGDLVATYLDQPQVAARTQIYWRAATSADAVARFELLVSVQTALLDSRPKLLAGSTVVAEHALQYSARGGQFDPIDPANFNSRLTSTGGYLFRLPNVPFSFAQYVHPGDSQGTQFELQPAEDGNRCRLVHSLFDGHLEKGVILRARVLGVLLDRAGDEEAAARQFGAFLAEELPLTT